jgi:hypothetical protein
MPLLRAPLAAPALSRLSVEGTDDVDERLPLEAQARLLRSALRIARADAAAAEASAAAARTQLTELSRAAGSAGEERTRLQRALSAAEAAVGKAKRAAASAETREAEARAESEATRREAREAASAGVGRRGGGGGGEGGGGEGVRLARALEDAEKLRASLAAERGLSAEVSAAHRRELEGLQGALRRAEKQRGGAFPFFFFLLASSHSRCHGFLFFPPSLSLSRPCTHARTTTHHILLHCQMQSCFQPFGSKPSS